MTQAEALTQFERLLANCTPPPDPDAVFAEWAPALAGLSVDDVADGITRLLRGKTDRWWPSIGELRGAIAAGQAGREPVCKCQRCGGTHWVEARPYRANGEHVYTGVVRCPDCGVPPPRLEGLGRQTPLSDGEWAQWRRPVEVIASRSEFLARVQALAGPKVRAALTPREIGEEG